MPPNQPQPQSDTIILTPQTPRPTLRRSHRATRNSPFFSLLPRELRDEVYACLFGFGVQGVRVGVGSGGERDFARRERWEGWGAWVFGGGKGGKHQEGRGRGRVRGCVCGKGKGDGDGDGDGWWEEGCLGEKERRRKKGGGGMEVKMNAFAWKGKGRRCQKGIMGWLLTCRLAYTESLHPLYSTTPFTLLHLTPTTLLSLSSLLLPQYLTSHITSLSLPFHALPLSRAHAHALSETLLSAFPSLRVLRLAIFHPFPQAFRAEHTVLIRVLRTVVQRLGKQVRHCELVVSSEEVYEMFLEMWKKEDGKEGEGEGEEEGGNGLVGGVYLRSFWVSVGLGNGDEDENGAKSGFWVAQSRELTAPINASD